MMKSRHLTLLGSENQESSLHPIPGSVGNFGSILLFKQQLGIVHLSEVEVVAIFQEATTTIAVFSIFPKSASYYIKSKQSLLNYT